MSLVTGVIFDLDGCLVDSEPLSLEAIASEMRMLGIKDATAQEIGNKFLGVAMPLIADYVSGRLDAPVPDNFVERVETRLLATYQNELRHISGSSELLSCLKAQGGVVRQNLTRIKVPRSHKPMMHKFGTTP